MTTEAQTITITIDGKEVPCEPGELVIEVAKRAGIYIPYFCYHPRMDPVGACRMCLISMQPGPPKPQTACTTRVSDGMVIETQFANEEIHQAQKGVLEFLLINHPLDCPICDRGGECPLQDQTQDYGPNESRFIEPKRRFTKPVPISPLIKLDRERCILCYRCTRFSDELSGDSLIGVMERGSRAFIFPFYSEDENGDGSGILGPDADDIQETFDSYFSGNTVQICPVGALTSSSYRFMARPWDIHNVTSTCNMCASGCSMHVGVRVQDGNVARFSGAINEDTNEEWLCDKGRYGNAYISSTERLSYPYARKDGELVPVAWDEAFRILVDKLQPILEGEGEAGILVGESLCDEDLYTAQKFARTVLRTNNVDHRLDGGLDADSANGIGNLTYDDVLGSDLVALVGLDAREELPILFLRLRIAATKRGLPLAVVHARDVALSEYASHRVRPVPGEEAAAAGELETALQEAERPVILLGPNLHAPDVIRAWSDVAERTGARLTWTPRRANTRGALAAGAHPQLLPGGRRVDVDDDRAKVATAWGMEVPSEAGLDATGILRKAADGGLALLWLVGADPIADVPEAGLGQRALEGASFVVVQDVQSVPTLASADLVLPAATIAERDGTLTDWEGRRQPVNAATDPPGSARADYAILSEAARRLDRPIGCRTADAIRDELREALGQPGSPTAERLDKAGQSDRGGTHRPPEPPAAASGGAASRDTLTLLTYRLLYDAGSRVSRNEGVEELTSKAFVEINPEDANGIADGDRVKVISDHGSIEVTARITDAIRPGVVFVPTNQPDASAYTLCTTDDRAPGVTVEKA